MAAPLWRSVWKFSTRYESLQYAVKGICRTFLSSSYKCELAWQKRLESEIIQKIRMEDYYYELDRKFQNDGKISAIDMDLFANSVKDEQQLEELQDILHRFRRTPQTIHTLPSTPHATIRTFLELGETDKLMKILDDRLNYGIFPDYYCSSLMMDLFLKQENYRDAAKVAILLMLQEDFEDQLCCDLALYSCHMYLQKPQPEPWDPDPPEVEEEPEEEVLVRVKYLRNPFFDDHFDVREPQHLIGKTLVFLGREQGGLVGKSYELIGWAMYNKWNEARDLINKIVEGSEKPSFAREGVKKFRELLGKIESGEANEKENIQEEFECLFKKLEDAGQICDDKLHVLLSEKVKATVAKFEKMHIENQEKKYEEWETSRHEFLQKQIDEYFRQERIKKLKEVKKELEKKEQLLFYFENKDKTDLKLEQRKPEFWKTHQNIPEHVLRRRAKIRAKDDKTYFPSEIETTFKK